MRAFFRFQEWTCQRLAPLFLPFYFVLFETGSDFTLAIALLLPLFVYFLSVAMLRSLLNQSRDDGKGGQVEKENWVGTISQTLKVAIVLSVFLLSVLSAIRLPLSPGLLCLFGADILFLLLSSAPSWGFRTNPSGIVFDSISLLVLPYTISAVIAATLLNTQNYQIIFLCSLSWQYFRVFRHLLARQMHDVDAAQLPGGQTLARSLGPKLSRRWQGRILPTLEFASLIALFSVLPYGGFYALLFSASVGIGLGILFSARKKGYRFIQDTFLAGRLFDPFSLFWLPIALLSLLSLDHPQYLTLLAVQLLLFGRPRIEVPPKPPRWRFSLSQPLGANGIFLQGWILNSQMFTRGIEITLDGLPAARMTPISTDLELGRIYAQRAENFSCFQGFLPLLGLPEKRRSLSVRIYSRNERYERVFLEYVEILLEKSTEREGPETFEGWTQVYRKDFRPALRRDIEGFPSRILVFHLTESLRPILEQSLSEAFLGKDFQIVYAQNEEELGGMRRKPPSGPHAIFLSTRDLSLQLIGSETLSELEHEGYLLVGFQAEDVEREENTGQLSQLARLDFCGPFTTPVFNHFVSRYLGVESFVGHLFAREKRYEAR